MKRLFELTSEEYQEFMERNGFSDRCYTFAMDTADMNVEEILYHFRHGNSWSIDFEVGYCVRGSYVRPAGMEMSKLEQFIEDCLDPDNTVVSEDTRALLKRACEKVECYHYGEILSDDRRASFEKWFEEIIEKASDEIYMACNDEYNYFADEYYDYCMESGFFGDYDANDFLDDSGEVIHPTDTWSHVQYYTCNGKMFDTYAEMAKEWNRTHSEPIPLF